MNASMASFRLPRSSWIIPIIEWHTHARFGSRGGGLELADGVVDEPHLLVRDAEVVVALRVVGADLPGHARP